MLLRDAFCLNDKSHLHQVSLPLINAEAVQQAFSQLFAQCQKNATDLSKYKAKTEKRMQRAEKRLHDFEVSTMRELMCLSQCARGLL